MTRRIGLIGATCVFLTASLSPTRGMGRPDAPIPDVVRARRLDLVDAKGTVRASMGEDSVGSTGFFLLDAAGKTRAALTMGTDGAPQLNLRDSVGRLRAVVTVPANGAPAVVLSDTSRRPRAIFSLDDANGAPGLGLFDSGGTHAPKLRATLNVDGKSGAPALDLFDATGQLRAVVALLNSGAPAIGAPTTGP